MIGLRIVTIVATLAILLDGCSSGGSHPPIAPAVVPSAAGGTSGATTSSGSTTFEWGQTYHDQSTFERTTTFSAMSVHVRLKMRDEAGLLAYARSASDPTSPSYRRFLTPSDIAARFGPSDSDVTAATAYFRKYGLSVATWPQHLTLIVGGAQNALEAAFGTTFGVYRHSGGEYVGPIGTPHFANALPVVSVYGLVHAHENHTDLVRAGAANFRGLAPSQIAAAYDYTGAYAAGYDGTGITAGIIGTGGISSADVPKYATLAHLTRYATVTEVPVVPQPPSTANGQTGTGAFGSDPTGFATPPPVTNICSTASSTAPSATCNPEDVEAQLDTEQIAGLAPGASVKFYLGYNTKDCANNLSAPLNCTGLQGLDEADSEIQQAIADNAADVVSLSYGEAENYANYVGYFDQNGAGIGPDEFAALAAEGIAVFVSSGDNGAWECFDPQSGAPSGQPCASYPSGDPSVVSVGGTNTPVDDTGKLSGEITVWGDQNTAGGSLLNNVGSGGGISQFFAAPSWQAGITPVGQPALTKRGQPDIALNGDPQTGPVVVYNSGFGALAGAIGGTSASAPDAAAMWAIVLQACKASATCATATGTHPYRLGNPAPLFYAILRNGKATPSSPALAYGNVFYDVLYGTNNAVGQPATGSGNVLIAGYGAGPGYDLVTGVGAPFAGHLIQAITGQAVP